MPAFLNPAATHWRVHYPARDRKRRTQCLVLAIDGVQWIDFESLAVWMRWFPDLEDARVVLITTADPTGATRGQRSAHAASRALLTSRLHQFVSFLLRSNRGCAVHARYLARRVTVIRSCSRSWSAVASRAVGLCELRASGACFGVMQWVAGGH